MADSASEKTWWQTLKFSAPVDSTMEWLRAKASSGFNEQINSLVSAFVPPPAGGTGTPAPTTQRPAAAPAPPANVPVPAPAAAADTPAPTASPPPAPDAPQGDRPWYAGILDGAKKLFGIGVDTSTGEKSGFDWGKIAKNTGKYGAVILGGIIGFHLASGGGIVAGIIGALIGYAITMAVATPLVKWAGEKVSGLFSGKSQHVSGPAPAHVVSVDSPTQEQGFVATVTTGAKKAWDTTVEVATNTWQSVTNTARSFAGTSEKPFSRVLAWMDKLNLPALETSRELELGLVSAIMHAESAGKNEAVSNKQAAGLMQFIPETAARYGMPNPQDRFIPERAVSGAASYLQDLSKMFNGHTPSMLAGYNWGEGRVKKLNREGYTITDDGFAEKDGKKFDLLPKETQGYIRKIMGVLPAYAEASTAIALAKASASPTVVADAGGGAERNAPTPDEVARNAALNAIAKAQASASGRAPAPAADIPVTSPHTPTGPLYTPTGPAADQQRIVVRI